MSDAIAMPSERCTAGKPWGFWATLGWTLLALVAGMSASGVAGAAYGHWVAGVTLSELLLGSASRTPIVGTLLILAFSVMVAVLVLAARRAGWSALSYFALVRPRGRYVLAGIVCVALPILLTFVHVQFDIREIIPAEQFGAARGRNILHLQFYLVVLSAVIAAPIMEEIMFRGFAYSGLSETRIGVAGTIVITSVVWAVIHINKGAAGIFDTAMAGIIWGWLRWYTGSLWVAIGAHMANNAIAVLMTVAAMYGLFG